MIQALNMFVKCFLIIRNKVSSTSEEASTFFSWLERRLGRRRAGPVAGKEGQVLSRYNETRLHPAGLGHYQLLLT